MYIFKTLLCLWLALLISGCAQNMALTKEQGSIDLSEKSIALLSVRVSNRNKPSFQPEIKNALIVPKDGITNTSYLFMVGDPYKETDDYKDYLLSFSLEPGMHHFRWIGVVYQTVPLIAAGCNINLDMKKDIKPKSVVYLGHMDAVIREKKNGESTNCPLLPLIDQAVAGFSTGVLDVTITDNFANDKNLFYSEFPSLKNLTIDKSILPAWKNKDNEYNSDIDQAQ